MPVSRMVADVGLLLETEARFSGISYFRSLQYLGDSGLGSVPLFFDPEARYFPELMYSKRTYEDSPEFSLVKWVQYYIQTHFRSSQELSPEWAIEFAKRIEFGGGDETAFVEEFHLDSTDDRLMIERLVPPVIPVTLVKFPIASDLLPNATAMDPDTNQYLFATPTRAVFRSAILPRLEKFFAENPDEDLLKFPIMAIGTDFFLGNILLAFLLMRQDDSPAFAKTVFNFYVFPPSSKFDSLGEYIAGEDPIYHMLVKHVFLASVKTAPVMEENSPLSFGTLDCENRLYEGNLWLSNPSPSSVLQWSIQHYLMFAREILPVRVWKCVMSVNG
jgi:hypothetical protein